MLLRNCSECDALWRAYSDAVANDTEAARKLRHTFLPAAEAKAEKLSSQTMQTRALAWRAIHLHEARAHQS